MSAGAPPGRAARFDLDAVRASFPALALCDRGRPRIYFDNPAGTQVPQAVIHGIADCLLHANANLGGTFETSERAGAIVDGAHAAMADLLNAASADEIVFGQNMTTLTLHVSRSIGRRLRPGDEIVLSRMDHDANVTPWRLLARDLGLEVRWLPFDPETFEFDPGILDSVIGERTRLVGVGAASNLTGTVNDVAAICSRARAVGALSYIDAVQFVPHLATDVQALGCDFLVCSAYKFFGPHQGILWGRREVLESLEPYKVRPAPDEIPGAFETGTLSHEGMAGTSAAVDYLAWIGETMAGGHVDENVRYPAGRRRCVHAAMDCIAEYEAGLTRRLLDGLAALPGVKVQGITAPGALARRIPTVAFTARGRSPVTIARALAERGMFVWSGHNFAVEAAMTLGIYESGGAVRVGPVHYNGAGEIDRLLEALDTIL